MTSVSIEQAYAEACRALGESIVVQRLQAQEIERLHTLIPPEQPEPTDR